MLRMLDTSKDYSVIGIHNHPSSSAPSLDDLHVVLIRKYKYGLVCCHNGTIYKYTAKEGFLENDDEFIFKIFELKLENKYKDSLEKMMEDARMSLEVIFDGR